MCAEKNIAYMILKAIHNLTVQYGGILPQCLTFLRQVRVLYLREKPGIPIFVPLEPSAAFKYFYFKKLTSSHKQP